MTLIVGGIFLMVVGLLLAVIERFQTRYPDGFMYRWVVVVFLAAGASVMATGAALEKRGNLDRAPLSQTEMIIAIEEVLRAQGAPAVCEPVSSTKINCITTVDPNDDL